MDFPDFAEKYPCIAQCLALIAMDGEFFLAPVLAEDHFPPNLEELEDEASRLSSDQEYNTFSVGERAEQEAIRERLGLHKLDAFLTEAFDGKYTEVFYG